MSQMDSAFEFLNDITEYQCTHMAVNNEDLKDACAHAARYIVQAMSPQLLTQREITERSLTLIGNIVEAVAEGKRVDALSYVS